MRIVSMLLDADTTWHPHCGGALAPLFQCICGFIDWHRFCLVDVTNIFKWL